VLEMLGIPVDSVLGEIKQVQVAHWNEAERAALEANMAARRRFWISSTAASMPMACTNIFR